MKSQYYIRVSPKGHPKLIEVVGSLPNLPPLSVATTRFKKLKKMSHSLSLKPLLNRRTIKHISPIKRISNEETINSCIRDLPAEIEHSQQIVQRNHNDYSAFNPKSYKSRLIDMINNKRFNVGSENISIAQASMGETDDKYYLRSHRSREHLHKLSNVKFDSMPLIDSKQVNIEIQKNIACLVKESEKMKAALKSAITQAQTKKDFFKGVKLSDIASVRGLLDDKPALIHELYALKQTALHIACKKNYTDLIKVLLDYNADPSARDVVYTLHSLGEHARRFVF
jgi:hypothetical protein